MNNSALGIRYPQYIFVLLDFLIPIWQIVRLGFLLFYSTKTFNIKLALRKLVQEVDCHKIPTPLAWGLWYIKKWAENFVYPCLFLGTAINHSLSL